MSEETAAPAPAPQNTPPPRPELPPAVGRAGIHLGQTERDIAARLSALDAPGAGPAAAPEPPPEAAAQQMPELEAEQEAPAADPEPEAPEAEAAEPEETDAAPDAQTEQDADGDDDEFVEVASLHDLASHLGIDVAELYKLKVPLRTEDGSKREVSLGEWKDGYLSNEEARDAAERRARAMEKLESAIEQNEGLYRDIATQAQYTMQNVNNLMLNDLAQVDWNKLRQENPQEWALKQQDLNQRQQWLAQLQNQSAQYLAQVKEQVEAQRQAYRQQVQQRENARLMKALPAWSDETAANRERAEIAEHLLSRGYTEDEVNNTLDHRAILLARDAMAYRKLKSQGDVAKQKVLKMPKPGVKPSGRRSAGEVRADKAVRLRKAHRENPGDLHAAAARIANLSQSQRKSPRRA